MLKKAFSSADLWLLVIMIEPVHNGLFTTNMYENAINSVTG